VARGLLPALACLLVFVSACGGGQAAVTPPTPAPSAAFPVTVTDQDGRAFTVQTQPRRIISYSPGVTEILFAIGADGQVAAADQFSDYPAAAKALAERVTYSNPDVERALGLNPDLVIMSRAQRTSVERFRDAGLPVFYIPEPASIDAILENVRMLGRMTGNAAEAEKVAASMEARIEAVKAQVVSITQGPRTYYEISDKLFTAGDRTFIGAMMSLLKAVNIASGTATDFPQLSAEAVIARDPEVIVLANANSGGQSLETLRRRPGWASISAVRDGRVYPIDPNIGTRPGPRIVDALEELGRLLYSGRTR